MVSLPAGPSQTPPPTGAGLPEQPELPRYVEAVLDVVDTVPAGRATTYGEVAQVLRLAGLGGGPRTVGQVMASYGGAVAWWRVVRSDGGAPACDPGTARRHWLAEAMPVRGQRVDLGRARVELCPPGWLADSPAGESPVGPPDRRAELRSDRPSGTPEGRPGGALRQ